MNQIKDIPPVLQRKLFLTILIGAACLTVGIAVFIMSTDTVMLILSLAVSLFSVLKCISLYHLAAQKQFEIVEGTCVGIASRPIRRYRKIKIIDDEGVESSLLLNKQSKVKIGYRYRFYFKSTDRITIGHAYFDTAIASDSFLGFEEIGEFIEPAKAEKTEDGQAG